MTATKLLALALVLGTACGNAATPNRTRGAESTCRAVATMETL